MKRSKKYWMPIVNYKLFTSAMMSTLSLSCFLFILALLNDRGKSSNMIVDDFQQPISTKLFDDKETFFDLIDDTEWRLAKSRLSSSNRFRRSVDGFSSTNDDKNKHHLLYYSYVNISNNNDNQDFDCDTVSSMVPSMSFLAAGWTKAVYKAKYNNVELAVKSVDVTGQDVNQCLESQQRIRNDYNTDVCYQKAAKKIIKEIALLKQLQHPNVIKVLGYCIPKTPNAKDSRNRVAIVTELGEPVNLIKLLQLSWEDRLRIVWSLAKLLNYLADHRLGSLVMNDMRRQQFVVVNGELKLVDVDDIGLEEPKCRTDDDCAGYITNLNSNNNTKSNNGVSLPCDGGVCRGFNEMRNVFNAARHFTTFLLPYGAPNELQDSVRFIVESFQNQTMKTNELLNLVDLLVKNYSMGLYLRPYRNRHKNFVEFKRSDLTGLHDYSCQGSKTQISCTLSMANVDEAASLCFAQPVCRAFVWTNEKSWTGRNFVHFKNNISSPMRNDKTVLYLKV